MNKFRTLRADEIDCRVSQIKENGLTLLLYKDARCDQNILDETVGPMNWQRQHSRDNHNCTVLIWDESKQQWIGKEDVGTPSNTESDKGLASDSFKRACFNWGVGRELYSAPFVFIPAGKCAIQKGSNGRPACYDHFSVREIGYRPDGARDICKLVIANDKTGEIVYNWTDKEARPVQKETDRAEEPAKPKAAPPKAETVQPKAAQPKAITKAQRFLLFGQNRGIDKNSLAKWVDAALKGGVISAAKVNDLTEQEYEALLTFVEANRDARTA